jgi:hypothetical protein
MEKGATEKCGGEVSGRYSVIVLQFQRNKESHFSVQDMILLSSYNFKEMKNLIFQYKI